MRLQYKITGSMVLIGFIVLLSITIFYAGLNKTNVIKVKSQNLKNAAIETAHYMNAQIESYVNISRTLASAPILRDALLESNLEFSILSVSEREETIQNLNKHWMESSDINDSVFHDRLVNPIADFFRMQQAQMTGVYGEIFLTNQYGVLVASTGKLTTLAHEQKYWWQASFFNGKGRVFIDDRGFDSSVDGYVLGFAIPIKADNGILGILKCNINIMGPLTNTITDYSNHNPGEIRIVRSGGLVIVEKGETPFTNRLNDKLLPYLQTYSAEVDIIECNDKTELVAIAPVQITINTYTYRFGGRQASIDHNKGNEGEWWSIVLTKDESLALKDVNTTNSVLFLLGIVFILITTLSAFFLSKWLTVPLVKFSKTVKKIGGGDLSVRIENNSNDEIGDLGRAFNNMTENLAGTLTSRDSLAREIIRREKSEIKNEELQEQLFHRSKMDAIGQLAGGIAHDFNNILNGIMNAAQLLKSPGRKLDEKGIAYVDLIYHASLRAADLTDKLLAYGHKSRIISSIINLNDIIDDTVLILKRTLDKRISLLVLKNAEKTHISGDSSSLGNALINLCINASQAMDEGGEIKISIQNVILDKKFCADSAFSIKPGEYCQIDVGDTGTGISSDNLKKIFEPFFTTKDQGKGSGLGLSAVYSSVEDHNGYITVSSSVGEGSVFSIFLPCSQ